MADTFTILSQEPTIERLGPTKTRPITIVTAIAKESGVVYWIKVLPANMTNAYLTQRNTTVARAMDTLAAKPGVIGVRVLEDTDPSDRFIQIVVVTVESSSGASTDDVRLSWEQAQGSAGYQRVAAVRARLDDVEGL
jgi:hypothetical protein